VTVIDYLRQYKKQLDPFLETYFEEKLRQARQIDPLAEEAVEIIKDFTLAGGKRVRPAVQYYGYLAAGGHKEERIINASMAIELAHSFLLIHDDIIDKDTVRHGVATVHERYKKNAQKYFPQADNEHFGNSMAMIAGDMAASMANEIIFNADFEPSVILKALDHLQKIIYRTIPGEMVDVVLEAKGGATEEEVLRMHKGKTAHYTFEGPIQLGYSLAGKDDNDEALKHLSDYAVNVGIAFQIRDDILGVFGDEKKLGKPVGSDVKEVKQTLLVIKAFEKSTPAQKKKLKRLLGKKDLSIDELAVFREIIVATGSLDYSQKLSQDLVSQALKDLTKVSFAEQEARAFFQAIAEYIIKREK
jgi:geranylgeranyl diphosphate synthase type I